MRIFRIDYRSVLSCLQNDRLFFELIEQFRDARSCIETYYLAFDRYFFQVAVKNFNLLCFWSSPKNVDVSFSKLATTCILPRIIQLCFYFLPSILVNVQFFNCFYHHKFTFASDTINLRTKTLILARFNRLYNLSCKILSLWCQICFPEYTFWFSIVFKTRRCFYHILAFTSEVFNSTT